MEKASHQAALFGMFSKSIRDMKALEYCLAAGLGVYFVAKEDVNRNDTNR
jgi:hypothetical protein